MLLFLSDLHLTDGTSGATIKPTAFRIFAESVKNLASEVKDLKEIRVVLLGDIFDVIRSSEWLGRDVRPWDAKSVAQNDAVTAIVDKILTENVSALDYLLSIEETANALKVPFAIEYIVGNHDWLINRYDKAIQAISERLSPSPSLPTTPSLPATQNLFATEAYFPAYKAYACHGDKYDAFNCAGDRDGASIGDAIVIELLNRFPNEVEKKLRDSEAFGITQEEKLRIVALLKEIDNVRPLLDVPTWVLMVQKKVENENVRRMIDETWHSCVNRFLKLDFIKRFDKFMWPDLVDGLELVLKLSSHSSGRMREKLAETMKSMMADTEGEEYQKRAYDELKLRSGEAKFVLYGHTHDHQVIPLDQVPNNILIPEDQIYFNTGTWRKTWNRTAFDRVNREFVGWHVLTYVALFSHDENGEYNFEVWNSALG